MIKKDVRSYGLASYTLFKLNLNNPGVNKRFRFFYNLKKTITTFKNHSSQKHRALFL